MLTATDIIFIIGFAVLVAAFFWLFVRQQERIDREGINPNSTIGTAVIEGFEQRLREEVRRRSNAEKRLAELRQEFENYKIETGKVVLRLNMELQRIASDRPRSDTGTYRNLKTGGRLFELLVKTHSLEDMKTLSFKLGVDPDSIEGGTKDVFARSLVYHTDTNQRLPELIALLKKERPDVDWPEYVH